MNRQAPPTRGTFLFAFARMNRALRVLGGRVYQEIARTARSLRSFGSAFEIARRDKYVAETTDFLRRLDQHETYPAMRAYIRSVPIVSAVRASDLDETGISLTEILLVDGTRIRRRGDGVIAEDVSIRLAAISLVRHMLRMAEIPDEDIEAVVGYRERRLAGGGEIQR